MDKEKFDEQRWRVSTYAQGRSIEKEMKKLRLRATLLLVTVITGLTLLIFFQIMILIWLS